MFNEPAKRETIYDSINAGLVREESRLAREGEGAALDLLGLRETSNQVGKTIPENNYQRSVRRQIARCIAQRMPSRMFVRLADFHSARLNLRLPKNRGSATRERNRARLVAAGLREAGL